MIPVLSTNEEKTTDEIFVKLRLFIDAFSNQEIH